MKKVTAKKKVAAKKIDIQKRVTVHMVMDGAGTRGWVHTHGMDALGLPEIEVRDVPTFMMFAAGALVNQVCDHMVNSGEVFKIGETMRVGRDIPFRFQELAPIAGDEAHFTHPRWALTDLEGEETAGFCQGHGLAS